jgi:preprotein translocase subunit SecE
MIAKIKEFFGNVVTEMKKVSWPTREQLRESTVVVIVTTIIITSLVWVIDMIMSGIVGMVFS